MSQKFERLKTLLKELFQLDQPDLDFGLYRIMHAKSAEVTQFLDQNLLPQVREAFALYKTAAHQLLGSEVIALADPWFFANDPDLRLPKPRCRTLSPQSSLRTSFSG